MSYSITPQKYREIGDRIDIETGKEAPFNIILQTLITILNWERDLRNALIMKDASLSADIMDSIRIMITPYLHAEARAELKQASDRINNIVYAVSKISPHTMAGKRQYTERQSLALVEIRNQWERVRLAMQDKGLLYAKPQDAKRAIMGDRI